MECQPRSFIVTRHLTFSVPLKAMIGSLCFILLFSVLMVEQSGGCFPGSVVGTVPGDYEARNRLVSILTSHELQVTSINMANNGKPAEIRNFPCRTRISGEDSQIARRVLPKELPWLCSVPWHIGPSHPSGILEGRPLG